MKFESDVIKTYLSTYSSSGNWLLVFAGSLLLTVIVTTNRVNTAEDRYDDYQLIEAFADENGLYRDVFALDYCAAERPDALPIQFSRAAFDQGLPKFTPGTSAYDIFDSEDTSGVDKLYQSVAENLAKWAETGPVDFFYREGARRSIPIRWDSKMPLGAFSNTFFQPHERQVIDAWALEHPLLEILRTDSTPNGQTYDQNGAHSAMFAGAQWPFEVDPSIKRPERVDLSNRALFDFSTNDQTILQLMGRKDYLLIDLQTQQNSDSLTIKLRFSSSRPKVFLGNAYEDKSYLPPFDRWPKATPNPPPAAVYINKYGDIYFHFEWKLLSFKCEPPMKLIGKHHGQEGEDSSIDLLRETYDSGQDLSVPFEALGPILRARITNARAASQFKLLDTKIGLKEAIYGGCAAMLILAIQMHLLLLRLTRSASRPDIQTTALELPKLDYHPGLLGRVLRITKSLSPITALGIAMLILTMNNPDISTTVTITYFLLVASGVMEALIRARWLNRHIS